jgi:hypothetical protein
MAELNTKSPILSAQKVVVIDVVTNTAAYTSGDQVGAPIKIEDVLRKDGEGVGHGMLKSVTIFDNDKQSAYFDLFFFNVDPTSLVTSTNNQPFAITAANQRTAGIGFARLDSTNGGYSDAAAGSQGEFPNIYKALWKTMADVDSGDLWVVPVVKSTPTYTGTSALQMKLVFWPN